MAVHGMTRRPRQEPISEAERELRIEVAAAYRMFDHLGWTELLSGHITAKVPGHADRFLINPYGPLFRHVTASSLVAVDIEGTILSDTEWSINPAGFVIHSAIHRARPELRCIMHSHTLAGMAVAAQEEGLLPISMPYTNFHDRIAYHEFSGPGSDWDERDAIAAALGPLDVLVLRNHGLLTCGRTVAEAFVLLFRLEKACAVQLAAQASGARLRRIRPEILEASAREMIRLLDRDTKGEAGKGIGEMDFRAMVRLMDEIDPSYRD
jgi:ribulose-5-phosphate 4-epimerase/fuculose-1-phosphate aldolase